MFEQNNMLGTQSLSIWPLDLKIEIPKAFENKILTRFYVILRFNNFYNTVKAMQILENASFDVKIPSFPLIS